MTPEALAALARAAYRHAPPWRARDFETALASPATILVTEAARGFVLARVAADEAEILALATAPAAQRQGVARRLLARFHDVARDRGARQAFLEVASDNDAAQTLYRRAGYAQAGLRPRYYPRPDGQAADALILSRALD